MISQKIKRESYSDQIVGLCASFEVEAFGLTDKGNKRNSNEDTFLICESTKNYGDSNVAHPAWLLAVSDGVGHGEPGRTASTMAVEALRNSVLMPSYHQPAKRLVFGMEIANKRIFDAAKNDVKMNGMATTLTAVLISNETAYVASVGNSRAYLIHEGQIMQLTKDHTLAQQLAEFNGTGERISKAAYKTLIQAVGNTPQIRSWQSAVDLVANDSILVCSDGLTSKLTESEIKRIIEENPYHPKRAAKLLVEESNSLGGDDNITVIIANFRYAARKSIPVAGELKVETTRFLSAAA